NLDQHTDIKPTIHLINNLNQLHFIEQTVTTNNINVALVKLAVTSLLRPVSTPYRLYLITLEREGDLALVLYHKTGKGNCQVIAQTLLTDFGRQYLGISFFKQSLV